MAQDLTTQTKACPPSIAKPSRSLERLLADQVGSAGYDENGQWIPVRGWHPPRVVSREILAEARTIGPQVKSRLEPIGRKNLAQRIAVLLAHYYVPDAHEAIQTAISDAWLEDLEEFPEWAIDDAFRDWRRTETRRPKIAELRSRCLELVQSDRDMLDRLRAIAICPTAGSGAAETCRPPITDEDKAHATELSRKVREQLAATAREIEAKSETYGSRPSRKRDQAA